MCVGRFISLHIKNSHKGGNFMGFNAFIPIIKTRKKD